MVTTFKQTIIQTTMFRSFNIMIAHHKILLLLTYFEIWRFEFVGLKCITSWKYYKDTFGGMTVFIILDVILFKFLSFVARHWLFLLIYKLMLFGIYQVNQLVKFIIQRICSICLPCFLPLLMITRGCWYSFFFFASDRTVYNYKQRSMNYMLS
jgi:hypothetical protein